MRESFIEKKIREFAEDNGCLTWKNAGSNARGTPDRQFLKAGRILYIEFKAPSKKPTALQEKWQRDLRAQGFICECVDNIRDGIELIRKHLLS
jgi:hypothetical protein